MGLATQLPVSWTARKFVGSTPRKLATPSTGSPPTTDLARRLRDLKDTPPPRVPPPFLLRGVLAGDLLGQHGGVRYGPMELEVNGVEERGRRSVLEVPQPLGEVSGRRGAGGGG